MLEQGPWQPEKFNGGWRTSVYNICNGVYGEQWL